MKHIHLDQHPSDVAQEILDYVNQKLADKKIKFSLVLKISGYHLEMEEINLDSDLDDEPLGTPAACTLGEACESCQ